MEALIAFLLPTGLYCLFNFLHLHVTQFKQVFTSKDFNHNFFSSFSSLMSSITPLKLLNGLSITLTRFDLLTKGIFISSSVSISSSTFSKNSVNLRHSHWNGISTFFCSQKTNDIWNTFDHVRYLSNQSSFNQNVTW